MEKELRLVFEDKKGIERDLEVVKIVCKEFWNFLWKKKLETVSTNHKVQTAKTATTNPTGQICADRQIIHLDNREIQPRIASF